jgi:hypothetical protein
VDAVLKGFDYLHDAPPGKLRTITLGLVASASLTCALVTLERGHRHAAPVPLVARRATVHRPRPVTRRAPPAAVPAPNPNPAARSRPASLARSQKRAGVVPVIRGIALGASPKALVEIGGRTFVVGLGSSLQRNVVTEIDSTGLLLADGSRLHLRAPPR